MRFDSYPPAVAVPPQVAPTPFRGGVIDVDPVAITAAASVTRQDMQRGFASFQHPDRDQSLTYTQRGQHAAAVKSGRTIDLFV